VGAVMGGAANSERWQVVIRQSKQSVARIKQADTEKKTVHSRGPAWTQSVRQYS
jgi:hypothetical protein